MYVSADKKHAILFAYNHHFRFGVMFDNTRPFCLGPLARYKIRDINVPALEKKQWSETSYTGKFLMKYGFKVVSSWGCTKDPLAIGLFGEYTSEVVGLKQVE